MKTHKFDDLISRSTVLERSLDKKKAFKGSDFMASGLAFPCPALVSKPNPSLLNSEDPRVMAMVGSYMNRDKAGLEKAKKSFFRDAEFKQVRSRLEKSKTLKKQAELEKLLARCEQEAATMEQMVDFLGGLPQQGVFPVGHKGVMVDALAKSVDRSDITVRIEDDPDPLTEALLNGTHKYSFHQAEVDEEGIRHLFEFAQNVMESEAFVLPYGACWIEWTGNSKRVGAVLKQYPDSRIEVRSFVYHEKPRSWVSVPYGCGFRQGENARVPFWLNKPDFILDPFKDPWARYFTMVPLALIALLSSKSSRIETFDSRSGRAVLKDASQETTYSLVTVRDVVETSSADGANVGTRKRPRMHWRSGFIRHYRSGKTKPIAPMLVAVSNGGFVDKDYLVKKKLKFSEVPSGV